MRTESNCKVTRLITFGNEAIIYRSGIFRSRALLSTSALITLIWFRFRFLQRNVQQSTDKWCMQFLAPSLSYSFFRGRTICTYEGMRLANWKIALPYHRFETGSLSKTEDIRQTTIQSNSAPFCVGQFEQPVNHAFPRGVSFCSTSRLKS